MNECMCKRTCPVCLFDPAGTVAEYDRLRAENARLREALETIARHDSVNWTARNIAIDTLSAEDTP